MNVFLKVTAGILLSLIVLLLTTKENKSYGVIISITLCCLLGSILVEFLTPILTFVEELHIVGNLNSDMFQVVLKAVGIGILTEITSLICADAGYGSLGKMLQVLSGVIILWLSLPLFTSLLELVEEILMNI